MQPAEDGPRLERSLGLVALTIYAVGDILGAGIYALVGRVAAVAGTSAWLSFAVAALVALFTGLTYAELSSRFPHAAGAAAYTKRAFASPRLAFVVGLFVLASGLTSAATVSLAFLGYLAPFVSVPPALGSVGLLGAMSLLSFRGMRESSGVNVVLTGVELFGLLLVLVGASTFLVHSGDSSVVARIQPDADVGAVFAGATIAFFAFIGFEDTANVAEEVHDPRRVLPRAILTALAVTTLLYVAVTMAALVALPSERLATSEAPLLEVLSAAGIVLPAGAFSVIALFAICNTGLLNLIMASRLTYGMAREGLLPRAFGAVHAKRRTPWAGVLLAFVLAAFLAVSGGVTILAQTTSLLLLCVFATLHVALLRVKRGGGSETEEGVFMTPWWTPAIGLILALALLTQFPAMAYLRVVVLFFLGLAGFRFMSSDERSIP